MASYIYLPVPTPGLQAIASTLQARINALAAGTCAAPRRNIVSRGRWKGIFRSLGCSGCLTGIGSTDVLYICIHGTGNLAMEVVSGERNRERELYDDPPADQQQLVKHVPNHLRPLGANPLASMAPVSDSKEYTAAQLAAVIEKEGLSKAHQRIELFACGAGMNDNAEQRAFEHQRVADQVREKFRHDIAAAGAGSERQGAMLGHMGARLDEVAAIVRARHERMDEAAALKRSFGERFFDAMRGRGYVGVTVNAYRGDVKAGLEANVPGLAAAPFAVVARETTHNPNAAGIRVTYPLPLG